MEIILKDLTYRYRNSGTLQRAPTYSFMLGPLSLTFDSTKVTAVVGSNGSGKTTLIRTLLRQFVETGGSYSVDNMAITDVQGDFCAAHGIGYSPEDPMLDEMLTGNEIAHIIKEIRAIPDQMFNEGMILLREQLHLEDWFETVRCSECSQGMRRKIALITAWLGGSQWVVIDEPTNGLDPLAVFGVKNLIRSNRARGVGTLICSHVLDLVEKIADRIVILRRGSVVYAGSLDTLMEKQPGTSLDEIYFKLFTETDTAAK